MSTGSVSGGAASPISVTGLASGLNTSSIIKALLEAEQQPINRVVHQQEKLSGQQSQLQALKSSLLSLSFAAEEFALPSLFEGVQSASSSEPARVSATITGGAGVGGYQLEVTQLANSAQRTFAFASPGAEDTVTIDGREYALKAGATAKDLASKINADSKGTVYAAVQGKGEETIVLSSRATGATEGAFIAVTDPGGALTEKAGTAKEGKNAEYKIDGAAGTSTSNTVTEAIAGVSLTFSALTTAGAVTIAVQPPAPNVKTIEAKLETFVNAYNKTVEEVEKQLTTKPLEHPGSGSELSVGSLFGDNELTGILTQMRQTMYETIKGLPEGMSSPLDLGISTGAGSGGSSSQSSLSGLLTLNTATLAKAISEHSSEAGHMMQQWSLSMSKVIRNASGPGGSLETRLGGEETQLREMKLRVSTMSQMLLVRQKALEQTYAQLETIISRNSAQSSWLTSQASQIEKSGL
jgi:flagellar hook-associated protein 2